MKAKEYVEKMKLQESHNLGIAILIQGLVGESGEMRKKRGDTTSVKAMVSILSELEKKYRAVQRMAPEFWEHEAFLKKSFLEVLDAVEPDLSSMYRKIVRQHEVNKEIMGRRGRKVIQ